MGYRQPALDAPGAEVDHSAMRHWTWILVLVACSSSTTQQQAERTKPTPPANQPVPAEQEVAYDPNLWISGLEDTADVERALTELARLKDPIAIPALARTWRRYNRASRILRIIVELADQTAPPEGVKRKRGPGPYWKDALPVLVEAVEHYDPGDVRTVEDAAFAADALGRSKDPSAIPILISTIERKMVKLNPAQRVRIAAVRALSHFPGSQPAVGTLIAVLQTHVTAQPINLNAAAAVSLGDSRSPAAIGPLLEAAYLMPAMYPQVRMALSKIGKPAIPALLDTLRGTHAELNEIARQEGFDVGCKRAMGPNTRCKAPGALEFKAATLLGDLRVTDALPILHKKLKSQEKVSYFDPRNGAPGPSTHAAFIDALMKIGDPSSVPELQTYIQGKANPEMTLPHAISAYSMLARDTKALKHLARLMKDDYEDEAIRQSAAIAYGRLARSDADLKPLRLMRNRYQTQAMKLTAKATAIDRKAGDPKKYSRGKGRQKQQALLGQAFELRRQAQDYDGFVEFFAEQMQRARPAIKCQRDVKCYTTLVGQTDVGLATELGLCSKDVCPVGLPLAKMTDPARERVILELAKAGPKARPALDAVLKYADSTERRLREAALFAIQRIAPRPCAKCTKRLAEIIEAQKDQSTLFVLTRDTQVFLNYLLQTQ
jgi:HEAT repeat protein